MSISISKDNQKSFTINVSAEAATSEFFTSITNVTGYTSRDGQNYLVCDGKVETQQSDAVGKIDSEKEALDRKEVEIHRKIVNIGLS